MIDIIVFVVGMTMFVVFFTLCVRGHDFPLHRRKQPDMVDGAKRIAASRAEYLRIEREAAEAWEDEFDPNRHRRYRDFRTGSYLNPPQYAGYDDMALILNPGLGNRRRVPHRPGSFSATRSVPMPGSPYAGYMSPNDQLSHAAYMDMMKKSSIAFRA